MTIAVPHPIKEVHAAIVNALNTASSLSGYLAQAWDYFAQYQATVDVGKATVYVTVEDSEGEQPDHSNAGESITSFLPTRFLLTCDTQLEQDADTYQTKTNTPSLLDLEARVISALQEVTLWGVPQYTKSWRIDSIQRDTPVLTDSGEIDPQIRRIEIMITVDLITERTDRAV